MATKIRPGRLHLCARDRKRHECAGVGAAVSIWHMPMRSGNLNSGSHQAHQLHSLPCSPRQEIIERRPKNSSGRGGCDMQRPPVA